MYTYYRAPMAHQREAFELSKDMKCFAFFMEQGTGKTKVALDTAAYLRGKGKICGLLVIADNGIHRNWVTDEIPEDLDPRLNWRTFTWQSGRATGKRYQEAFTQFLHDRASFRIFAVNIDAVITKRGHVAIERFLKSGPMLMVVDESTSIKTPKAKRTRATILLGRHAPYRRIMTGTPFAEGPFMVYAPFRFLDVAIIGIRSYFAFKHEFGIWTKGLAGSGTEQRSYPILIEYQNLDALRRVIAPFSYRVLKKDCLDLKPKVHTKRYFELSPEQRRLYNQLRKDYIIELRDAKGRKEPGVVSLALTRMLRLQQISCGHLPNINADEPAVSLVVKENARMKLLEQIMDELPKSTKVLIWCRFTRDIDQICELLGADCVRYDGTVKDDDRARNKKKFQVGKVRVFVGHPKAGGKGLTLVQATCVIFYSNLFGYEPRIQAEDRAHRKGQENRVTYIDLVGVDTVDERIVKALRSKRNLSDTLTGDAPEEWL